MLHGTLPSRTDETIPFQEAFAELRRALAAQPLRPMPVVVISRGRPVALPADASIPPRFSEALERAWRLRQASLVAIAPHARQVIAEHSEHYVELEQPDLVVKAIRDVVDAVRAGHPWARTVFVHQYRPVHALGERLDGQIDSARLAQRYASAGG